MLYKVFQILLFQGVFIVLYDLWLQKETFYSVNRFYLLFTSLFSLVLPFLPLQITNTTLVGGQFKALSDVVLTATGAQQLPEVLLSDTATNNSISLIVMFYIAGVSLALSVFLWKLYKLFVLIHSSKKYKKATYTIVSLKDEHKVFSFQKYIFIGEKDLDKQDYLLYHELIHIRHKHSLDLLWFELLKIVLWFNPFVYFYQKRITALHEFIADAESLKVSDKKSYYNHLLNDIFQVENMTFVNQFYTKSLIKKRINMMTKQQSKSWKKVKYLFVIPIMFLMLLSCSESKDKALEIQKESSAVPFSVVQKAPVYPGCEDIEDKEEQKKCLSKSIQIHVSKKFDVDLAQTLDLTPGKKRIFTMFTIDEEGNISDIKVRAPHKALEAEALKVVKSLPKMQPGKDKNGKSVAVKYSLPIVFLIEGDVVDKNKEDKMDIDAVPVSKIDEVPIYPGCEEKEDNDARLKCLSSSIQKHIAENFNTKLADNLELSSGKKRINVLFTIDKEGNIDKVKARAPHKVLEEEAIRVIKKLPKMQAGKQAGEKVSVKYAIPISFIIEDNKTK